MPMEKKEVPKEVSDKAYEAVSMAKATGRISKGVNETTKSIERGSAKLVVMAADVSPEEILMHIPVLCDEKKVPHVFVPSKEELGRAAGIDVPTSSIAVTEAGEGRDIIADIVKRLGTPKGAEEAPKTEPKEEEKVENEKKPEKEPEEKKAKKEPKPKKTGKK